MGSGRAPSPPYTSLPRVSESLLSHRAWPSSFCTRVHRMSSDRDVTFVLWNSSTNSSTLQAAEFPMEEVFSVGVWLFKLNYQLLTPSSPHQSRVQRPHNISLVSQHCSPLKHPRAFLSPSLPSLASPRPLPSLWCLPWLHTETPLHLCRGTAHPRGCPGLGADTGTPATGTRLYPKSGYFFCKGGRNGAA